MTCVCHVAMSPRFWFCASFIYLVWYKLYADNQNVVYHTKKNMVTMVMYIK